MDARCIKLGFAFRAGQRRGDSPAGSSPCRPSGDLPSAPLPTLSGFRPGPFPVRAVAAVAVLGLACLLSPADARAQGSATLHACYVPRSGTVYRIKTPDTPPACVRASHVPFSWEREPAPAGLYAVVNASGVLDAGLSRGFIVAHRVAPGHYCVTAPAGVAVSRPPFVGPASADDPVHVAWNDEAGPDKAGYCGADDFGVSIYQNGIPTDYPFTIFVP